MGGVEADEVVICDVRAEVLAKGRGVWLKQRLDIRDKQT